MPWTETCVMKERVKFIMDVFDGTYNITVLCHARTLFISSLDCKAL